ncbi:hypothetical protein HDU76_011989 [Blyttiomyces sp. JEL0837]|nr:hypothetical protein HDU76_011989 [Blyttiomyces sp. JEL0837]
MGRKGKTKPNYGFPSGSSRKNKLHLKGFEQNDQQSREARSADELEAYQDYLANASDGDNDMSTVSQLAELGVDSDMSMPGVGSEQDDDDSDDDEDGYEVDEVGGRRLRLPESGLYEEFMAMMDPSISDHDDKNQVESEDADSESDDESDMEDVNRHGMTISSPNTNINNNRSKTTMSKSALKKARKREHREKVRSRREKKLEMRKEQQHISGKMSRLRTGDAIPSDVKRLLEKMNRRILEFVQQDVDDDQGEDEDQDEEMEDNTTTNDNENNNNNNPTMNIEPSSSQTATKTPKHQEILPPMPSAFRRLIKVISQQYNLTTKTRGSGISKCLILSRTRQTRVPENWRKLVDTVLQQGSNGLVFGNTRLGGRGKKKRKPPGNPDLRGMPKPGELVGENAAPLSEENKGHRMMLAMGWSPGQGLGSASASGSGSGSVTEEGGPLIDPIAVMIRPRRLGLGSEGMGL